MKIIIDAKSTMYLLKTKGSSKISDYIQIRDNNFVLIAHFSVNNIAIGLQKNGFKNHIKEITEQINYLPYGKLHKIKL